MGEMNQSTEQVYLELESAIHELSSRQWKDHVHYEQTRLTPVIIFIQYVYEDLLRATQPKEYLSERTVTFSHQNVFINALENT